MKNENAIKESVREKYANIAEAASCGCGSCCGVESSVEFSMIQDDYSKLDGYVKDADLGLGCGLPTEFADIKPGNTVVDLGSGAGNDIFVARSFTGESGHLIGVDFTPEMLAKANNNLNKIGYTNIEFRLGDIEAMPIADNTADVVVSNCVLNLVPNKQKAFSEIYRILKNGGHFCISDVVINGIMTERLQQSAVLYAGCVSGALQQEDYLSIISSAGFSDVTVRKSKNIDIPDEILLKYTGEDGLKEYKQSIAGIFSITVTGVKKS